MHAKYRNSLPQLDGRLFLTDSGLETTILFDLGIDLPHFAAFDLLRDRVSRMVVEAYYRRHLQMALARGTGFVMESATWRAHADWGPKLGYDAHALDAANRDCIAQLRGIRDRYETAATPCVISGNIGPRGDGYVAGAIMTVSEAEAYHAVQVESLDRAGVDLVTAMTLTNVPEAIGIVRAAKARQVPVVISFTLETDGRLPAGDTLGDAIAAVDRATGDAAAYFMINCAHPTHFMGMLAEAGDWKHRIRGIRANASRMSHAELDAATELDDGDPQELGAEYAELMALLPDLAVIGGCCGTDHRHVAAAADCCLGPQSLAA
ncbi:homocysteine S-methyltransferase family protein [Minwuia sp.]|uniref:homocysteine S-methyltransferase family protein n=1 Tax=Minwuia sp. TaxID=2493630 RepID=UPI003A8F8528